MTAATISARVQSRHRAEVFRLRFSSKSGRREYGTLIFTERQMRDWTIAELSRRAGVAWGTVAYIENAQTEYPQGRTVEKILEALGYKLVVSALKESE